MPLNDSEMGSGNLKRSHTCSSVIEPSRSSIFCRPGTEGAASSSSSSSSSIPPRPPLIAAKAELLPANEKGLDFTAVPNTLVVDGAPNVAKSVTTLRGGELVGVGGIPEENEDEEEPNTVLLSGDRGGIDGE